MSNAPKRTLRELREELNDEQVKNILMQFNVEPYAETDAAIIYPTVCHNLDGGNPKLYYYKNTKLFKCYTECNEIFDIFKLLQMMMALRGKPITIPQAIEMCDLQNESVDTNYDPRDIEDLRYLEELHNTVVDVNQLRPLKFYDKNTLNRYIFSMDGVRSWIEEGISLSAIEKFGIKFDPISNAIIIPNYDIEGNLIGVRGRFLDPDAPAKYAPMYYNGAYLAHPTGRSFYGIHENKKKIEEKHRVVIFEGEKSVMKFETYYPGENIALATLGKTITNEHIRLLLKMKVSHVILAYDADYETEAELTAKREEYTKIAKILKTYFTVSILLDFNLKLNYKDSPIDGGKEYFEELLKNRLVLK
jgi:5S rRNA maturation endonuclease (ribonuclease M5)